MSAPGLTVDDKHRILSVDPHEVLDDLDVGIVVVAPDGYLEYVNDAYLKLFGFTRRELSRFETLDALIHCYATEGDHLNGRREQVSIRQRYRRREAFRFERGSPRTGRDVLVDVSPTRTGGLIIKNFDVTERRSAERRAERERRYVEITLGSMSQGLCLFDADNVLRVANQRFYEFLDLPPERLPVGTPMDAILRYSDDTDGTRATFRRELLARMENQAFERERPDGTVIEVVGKALPDNSFVSVYSDITKRRQAEAQLDRRAQEMLVTIDTIGDLGIGICFFDRDKRLGVANARYYELTELDPKTFPIGTHIGELFRFNAERGEYGEGDTDTHVAKRLALVERMVPHRFQRISASGKVLEIAGAPLDQGGFVSVYVDITEKVAYQKSIEDEKLVLERTLNSLDEGVTLFDGELILRATNESFYRIMGIPADRFPVGSTFGDYIRFNAERGEYGDVDIEELVRRREGTARDLRGHRFERKRPDGTTVEIRGGPLPTGGFISIYTDVTQQRLAEQNLIDAKDNAERALDELRATQHALVQVEKMAALGRLVAGIAHEVNTPVGNTYTAASTAAVALAEMKEKTTEKKIRKRDLDAFFDSMEEGFEIILGNSLIAHDLIQGFKQVAVDRTTSDRRQFNLSTLIDELLLTLRPQIRRRPHLIQKHAPGDIIMDSYPGPLHQVMTNIVSNALDHAFDDGEEGEIEIRATRTDGDMVVLTVSDDGRGISREHLGKVFDPFFTTRMGSGGTGLGLHIAFSIVTGILGGRITVDSTVGAGTTFRIAIPAAAPEPDQPRDDITRRLQALDGGTHD